VIYICAKLSYYEHNCCVIIKGEPGEEGNRGPPGKQGAEGEPGLYIPELDEIIAGNIGIQGELGQYVKICALFGFTRIF